MKGSVGQEDVEGAGGRRRGRGMGRTRGRENERMHFERSVPDTQPWCHFRSGNVSAFL